MPVHRGRRRSAPVRVILWSLATIAGCVAAFCLLLVVATIVSIATGHVPPPTAGR
jgi:hypothetical protein